MLQDPTHFDKICELNTKPKSPIHLLSHSAGSFRWLRSDGNIDNVQIVVDHLQDEIAEDEFVELFLKSKHNSPVLISGLEGAGKSVFLANIGKRLSKYSDKILTFVGIAKLTAEVQQIIREYPEPNLVEIIRNYLLNLTCTNVLARIFLASKMTSEKSSINVELLMDGLDELSPADLEAGYNLVKIITKNFNSIRVWLAIRPKHLHSSER